MMYFSRLKTALVLGVCVLGVLLCAAEPVPRPGALAALAHHPSRAGPARRQLPADGSGHERGDPASGWRAWPTARAHVAAPRRHRPLRWSRRSRPRSRLLIPLDEPAKQDAALRRAARPGDHQRPGRHRPARPGPRHPARRQRHRDAVAGGADTSAPPRAVQQSIEIVRRRIDETGVVDPQIARQGDRPHRGAVAGHRAIPNRIKELLGKTAQMTFQLVDENVNPTPRLPPPGRASSCPMQSSPGQKIAVRRRVEVDGADLTDAQAGQNPQTGEWVVNFTFNSHRRAPLRRCHAAPMSATASPSCWTTR